MALDSSSWLFSGLHQCGSFLTRGQFWPPGIVIAWSVCVCVYQSLACPHDNSSPVQARITKFGPEKQNTLVKIPIVFGSGWLWPSRSNLTSNSKLPPFWACPTHYASPIQVRISKFGPQMHFSAVKIPVNSELDWSWTLLSFLIPKIICLHWGGVHWDCETVPCLFQCCSGTVSQSLHSAHGECTANVEWGLHCCCWTKSSHRLFHSMTVSQYDHVVPYTDLGDRGYFGVNAALVNCPVDSTDNASFSLYCGR